MWGPSAATGATPWRRKYPVRTDKRALIMIRCEHDEPCNEDVASR